MMSPHGNPLSSLIKKFLASHAAACLASGESAKKYFLDCGAKEDRIHIHTFSTLHESDILKELISKEQKLQLRKKLSLPANDFISIAVGRFIPLKRYDCLIKEWKNMPERHTLLLVGSGSEEEKYRKIIRDSNIKNVIVERFHPKEELFDYYKASDVFVHPTSYDVWGLVLNEAFACSLPAVVSDHCVAGLELINEDQNGFLVPMGDDKLLCEKVIEIAENEALYKNMSAAALDTIKDYTIENMAKAHIDVLSTL
jgi:glycosyltransferase involved in cell wall biosynthesis